MENKLENIIKHPQFQEKLQEIAISEKKGIAKIKKEAENCIKELYSQQHPVANILSIKGFQFMMSKAYSNKIDINREEIKNLMNLMKQHSVAFILTHKTYLDTVVLVNTLARYGIPIPHIWWNKFSFPRL